MRPLVQDLIEARCVFKRPDPHSILAAEELFYRINSHVQVVIEQIVVGTVRTVVAAQIVGLAKDQRRRLPVGGGARSEAVCAIPCAPAE